MCLPCTRKSETEPSFNISGKSIFAPLIVPLVILTISPYMSADMRRMAEAFNTSVAALEDELMQLILDGQIQARIDSHNKVVTLLLCFVLL